MTTSVQDINEEGGTQNIPTYNPNETIKVYLVPPFSNGRNNGLEFRTKLGNSVSGLKLAIEESKIAQESQYYLMFDKNFLHNEWILGDVGVADGSNLFMCPRKFIKVNIESDVGNVELSMSEDVLIGELKSNLAPSFGVTENRLSLFFGESECEDDKALFELGITDTSTIKAVINDSINVIIRYISTDISCNVSGSSKILEIKEILSKTLNNPPEYIKLHYAGNELSDNQTLNEYQIQNDSVIEATLVILGGF